MKLGPTRSEERRIERLVQAGVEGVPRVEQEYGHRSVALVPGSLGHAEDVGGEALRLASLRLIGDGAERAIEREQDSGDVLVIELAQQVVDAVSQQVPVGV